jgi:hypothetical protein
MRIALLLLLAVPPVALGQAGRFLLAAGEVTVVRGAQEIRAATGTAVEPGDTIRIGPRSNVQLRMSDQQIISLRASTVFRIDDYSYAGSGDETNRSIFSLVRGGMRTVGGAIARQHSSEAFLRAAARPDASGPQPAAEEKKPESDRKMVDLAKAPLRRVAGALTPMRHAVRVPMATIGVRGTHYTVVHCDNDCAAGAGSSAPNGTYGGVSDGLIEVFNNRDQQQFGANSFFYVATAESSIQSLIGPPAFLYDRLEGQDRNRGLRSVESSVTMARSGLNAESRPSEAPVPPRLPAFVVTEVRTEAGAVAVVPGAPARPAPSAVAPVTPVPLPPVAVNTAFLSAFSNAAGGPNTAGAFVDASALALQDVGGGIVLLASFNVPAGSTVDKATGAYSGAGASVANQSFPNALNAYWGLWFDGTVTDATGTTTVAAGKPFFHYLVGPNTPPEVIAAKRGSFGFDLVQNTFSATNNLGEFALPITGRMATIDFDNRQVTFDPVRFAFPSGQAWTFGATNPAPIVIGAAGASVRASATGSCASSPTPGCGGPAQLDRTAIFKGPVGDHLGVAFQAHTLSGPAASLQGTKILTCNPSPC